MLRIIHRFNTTEKIIVILLTIIILFCSGQIVWTFYKENSQITPSEGDMYREGLVGEIQFLNPVLAVTDTDRDINRLIYSGLVRYNPETKKLEDDIATHVLSHNKKVYTFTLLKNAKWHDGTPVTADDVIFTYKDVIQNENFKNTNLKASYNNVLIEKIDEQTVTFTLKKPYKFFLADLTIGLLPKHIVETTPVEKLDTSEINLIPVGTGPYAFNKISQEGESVDVYLNKFEDYYTRRPFIDRVKISVFNNFEHLIEKTDQLDAIQNIPKQYRNEILNSGKYNSFNYELNQYVAVFFNLNNEKTKDVKIRLGLQLSTNKQEIIDRINEKKIIDTPLLEINQDDWQYKFDPVKAAGAFYDSQWKIPQKEDSSKLISNTTGSGTITASGSKTTEIKLEETTVNNITTPNDGKDWITNKSKFEIKGSVPANTTKIIVNNYTLKKFKPHHTEWAYAVNKKYHNLKEGQNIYKIYVVNKKGIKKLIDEIKITYYSNKDDYDKAIKKIEKDLSISEKSNSTKTSSGSIKDTASGEIIHIDKEKEAELVKKKLKSLEGIIRENDKGEKLSFTLITSHDLPEFQDVAIALKEQWKKAGVDIKIEILESKEFAERLKKREYDLLLFGQNLGYNLDAYPYWHSSQIAKNNGYNLSEYKSLQADVLIEEIRATHDEELRQKSLKELQEVIRDDVPAIYIYTPTYTYAVDTKVQKAQAVNLATSSDRFNNIENWFIKMERHFNTDASWFDFFGWLADKTF